jgi:hypothetical protein
VRAWDLVVQNKQEPWLLETAQICIKTCRFRILRWLNGDIQEPEKGELLNISGTSFPWKLQRIYLAKLTVWTSLNISGAPHFASSEGMLVYSSDIYLLCHKFTINYTMKFIELRVKIQHSQESARRGAILAISV